MTELWTHFVEFVQKEYPGRPLFLLDADTPSIVTGFLRFVVEEAQGPTSDDQLKWLISDYVKVIGQRFADQNSTEGVYWRGKDGVWSGLPTISVTVHTFVAKLFDKPIAPLSERRSNQVQSNEVKQKAQTKVGSKPAASDIVGGFFVPDSGRHDVSSWIKYCKYVATKCPGVGPLELRADTPQLIADFLIWACSDKRSKDENGKLYGCLGLSPTSGRALASAISFQFIGYYDCNSKFQQQNDETFTGNPTLSTEVSEALLYLKYGKSYLSPNSRNKKQVISELADLSQEVLVKLNDRKLNGSYWEVDSRGRSIEKRKSQELKVDIYKNTADDDRWDEYCQYVQTHHPGRDPLTLDAQSPTILVDFFKYVAEGQQQRRSSLMLPLYKLQRYRQSIRKRFETHYNSQCHFRKTSNGMYEGSPTLATAVREYFDILAEQKAKENTIANDEYSNMTQKQEQVEELLSLQDVSVYNELKPDSMTLVQRIANENMPTYQLTQSKMASRSGTQHIVLEEMFRQSFARLCQASKFKQADFTGYAACLISFLGLISMDEVIQLRKGAIRFYDETVKIAFKSGRIYEFEVNSYEPHLCVVSVLKTVRYDKSHGQLVTDSLSQHRGANAVLQTVKPEIVDQFLSSRSFQTAGCFYYRHVERWTIDQIATWSYDLSAVDVRQLLKQTPQC